MKNKIYLVLFIAIIGISNINAQVSRGPTSGELYITGKYAIDVGTYYEEFSILIHSDNYGRNFTQKYLYQYDSGNTLLGQVLADATPEVLYNIVSNKYTNDPEKWGLYRSINDGESWEFLEYDNSQTVRYSTGEIDGKIYKYSDNGFFYSNQYGNDFSLKNDTIFGFPEVGQIPGSIYMLSGSTYPTHKRILHHSSDYGESFSTNEVDSSIIGHVFSGKFPTISRGAIPGELYFIS